MNSHKVPKYINSLMIEIKLDFRSRINIFLLILTSFICSFEFFYIMPKDRVCGNSIALSSWITQLYIILGVAYGIFLSEKETKEITELLISLKMDLVKRICQIVMVIVEAVLIYVICLLGVTISLKMQEASEVIFELAYKYIWLYWVTPFIITSIFGLILTHRINGKSKYAFGIMMIIISGPMLPSLLEPIIDTRTGIYKYISIFNIGPLNASKPMNLIFGYSLPFEKIVMNISIILAGIILFICGSKLKKGIRYIGMILSVFIMLFSYYINYKYIVRNYDYEIAMGIYEDYSFETTKEPNNNYQIEAMNINVTETINNFFVDVDFTITCKEQASYITFMLYHDFIIEQINLDGEAIDFFNEKDLVAITGTFEEGESHEIHISYKGRPAIHMYSDKDNWIFPAYFAWYPMQGDSQNIIYENDLFSVDFVSNKPEQDIYFTLFFNGKNTPYCNLVEEDKNNWSGYAKGITLFNSEMMEIKIIDDNTYIYPILCRNYENNVKDYAQCLKQYRKVLGLENEQNQIYLFLCDTTYTGHGEKINSIGNQTIIEITRAYIDGNELSNPNLGIYALIKDEYLKYANDVDLEYIYVCTFVSTMVKQGMIGSNVLVRDLDDLYSIYHGNNGYEKMAELTLKIKEFISEKDAEQQNLFLERFSNILNSGEYTLNDVFELLERNE